MLSQEERDRLMRFGQALINQQRARVIVPANQPKGGFWFGGGNMVEAPDGVFYLVGRYRNAGDSRTGLGLGERGLELAVFRSEDCGQTFAKILSFSKGDLSLPQHPVISIEGAALRLSPGQAELFVSSEKGGLPYPPGLEGFQKQGTGVWTVDRLVASSVEGLRDAQVESLLRGDDPPYWHVKDPLAYDLVDGGLFLGFCTHPHSWSSSNSGYMVRSNGAPGFGSPAWDFLRRGVTWDVAMTRLTCLLRVPSVGPFARRAMLALAFYDGGECVRNHEEHTQAIKRPRGYSCEELGGLAVVPEGQWAAIERLSVNLPAFVSPWGTGCSRYVDVLETAEGYYATWQQSQADFSQPLVMNIVSRREAEALLS